MGLLDKPGRPGESAGEEIDLAAAKKALTTAVVGMLVHGNEPGGLGGSGGMGGLSGLLQRFNSAGFGPEAASWVSSGTNLPIASTAVEAALGDGPLRVLAEHIGLDEAQTARYLSILLPKLVDRLTPNGELPEPSLPVGGMEGAVESFTHIFASHTKIM